MRALLRRFREQDAVIGDDADRIAVEVSESGDQCGAIELLELVEFAAIDETGDHLARIIGPAQVGGHHAIQLGRVVERLTRLPHRQVRLLHPVQIADDLARDGQRMRVVLGVMVGHAGNPGMHVGTAQILRRHHLAGRRLHQRRAAQEDRPLPLHDDALVRHRRYIGTARRAAAHHHGDLRNAGCGQRRLIVEDAAEMVAVREHLVLVRQVGAAGIDQIEAGQIVLPCDLLRPQMLLHGQRIVGTALHRGVIGDDDAFLARDAANAGDDAGRRDIPAIHAVGSELRQLQKGRADIQQRAHPVARQQLAPRQMPLAGLLAAALLDAVQLRLQILDQRTHRRFVLAERLAAGADLAFQDAHAVVLTSRRSPASVPDGPSGHCPRTARLRR